MLNLAALLNFTRQLHGILKRLEESYMASPTWHLQEAATWHPQEAGRVVTAMTSFPRLKDGNACAALGPTSTEGAFVRLLNCIQPGLRMII